MIGIGASGKEEVASSIGRTLIYNGKCEQHHINTEHFLLLYGARPVLISIHWHAACVWQTAIAKKELTRATVPTSSTNAFNAFWYCGRDKDASASLHAPCRAAAGVGCPLTKCAMSVSSQ